MDFLSHVVKSGQLKGNFVFLIGNLWAAPVSVEHSQDSLQKKNNQQTSTLLNGNFVLAGWIACNNGLQTIIFTIFVMLYFGLATEHDSFLKKNNECISKEERNNRSFSEC